MELTRRDALVALAAVGAADAAMGGVTSIQDEEDKSERDEPLSDDEIRQLTTVAEVIYPSKVETTEEFVRTYTVGRYNHREEYVQGVRTALRSIDEFARDWFGKRYVSLSSGDRETVLNQIGVRRVPPNPDGVMPERVRYYVVNDLLYALYTTPTGGKLVGKENPDGYPGGREAYQQGPDT